MCFRHIDEGADHGEIHAVEISNGVERAEAAFEEDIQQQRFCGIVLMMSQRHFAKAVILGQIVQRAAAHLGAKRTGIAFLPHIEDDFADLRLFAIKGHIQLFTVAAQRLRVITGEAERNVPGRQRKFVFVDALELL